MRTQVELTTLMEAATLVEVVEELLLGPSADATAGRGQLYLAVLVVVEEYSLVSGHGPPSTTSAQLPELEAPSHCYHLLPSGLVGLPDIHFFF